MYSVYKITNQINNMCYIGSSVRVKKRWREEINASKNSNARTYNYPLSIAFREYGIDNFTFEVIRDDFENVWDMEEYEQAMIDYYHSLAPQGYNQTRATHSNNIMAENRQKYNEKISQKCAKIDKNNNIIEVYNSYHEAARKNGFDGDNYATKIRNICKGKTSSFKDELIFRDLNKDNKIITQPIKSYKAKKRIIGIHIDTQDEIYFDSISEAAKKLKTDRCSISKCIQGNKRYSNVKSYIFRELDYQGDIIEVENTIENILSEYNRTNPLINGERHNIKEWCKIYGISTQSFYRRLEKGLSVEEAITTPKRR